MKILCLSVPLTGHLDWGGYLATAVELQRRGHEVLWASGAAVANQVTAAGIPFHRLAQTGWRVLDSAASTARQENAATPEEAQRIRARRAVDQWLDQALVRGAGQEIIELAQRVQPDVIMSEMFVAAAGIAAEALGVPLLVAGWPAHQVRSEAPTDALTVEVNQRIIDLLGEFAVSGVNWSLTGMPMLCSPWLHLSYWSERWFDQLPLLAQTRHVGGQALAAMPADATFPSPDQRPWVLITLGTTFGNDPNFFIAAAHAAERLGCLAILALAGQVPAGEVENLKRRLPPHSLICDRVNFAAVLPYTAAAIHHGGAGVTHALVTQAVPQIIVPHAADQYRQAQGAVRSGVGIHLPAKSVTIDLLEQGLAAILPDLSEYRSAAQELRAEFATLGGVVKAAELVEQVARR